MNHPVQAVASAFDRPEPWCTAMPLHIDTRRCTVFGDGTSRQIIRLNVVRKYDPPVENAFWLAFYLKMLEVTPQRLERELTADAGPSCMRLTGLATWTSSPRMHISKSGRLQAPACAPVDGHIDGEAGHPAKPTRP